MQNNGLVLRPLRIKNDPSIIKNNVIRIFNNNKHASVLGQRIGNYFKILEEKDIINSFKISIDEISGKIHISWKWIYGAVSFSLSLREKITTLPQKIQKSFKEDN